MQQPQELHRPPHRRQEASKRKRPERKKVDPKGKDAKHRRAATKKRLRRIYKKRLLTRLQKKWRNASTFERVVMVMLLALGIGVFGLGLYYCVPMVLSALGEREVNNRVALSRHAPATLQHYSRMAVQLTNDLKPSNFAPVPDQAWEAVMGEGIIDPTQINNGDLQLLIQYAGMDARVAKARGTQSLKDFRAPLRTVLAGLQLTVGEQTTVNRNIEYLVWLERSLFLGGNALKLGGGRCDELSSVAVLRLIELAREEAGCVDIAYANVMYTKEVSRVVTHSFLLVHTGARDVPIGSLDEVNEADREHFVIVDPWARRVVPLPEVFEDPDQHELYVGSNIADMRINHDLTCPNHTAVRAIDETRGVNLAAFFQRAAAAVISEFRERVEEAALSPAESQLGA